MSTLNAIVNEPNRVIIYDAFAKSVIHDQIAYVEEDEKDSRDKFLEEFEVVKSPREYWEANPNEDYYQGIEVMVVIRRKNDGQLFGFSYWTPISKHGESFVESNGDSFPELEFDVPDDFDWNNGYYPEPFVFLPVEPFTITGYKIKEDDD